MRRVRFEAARRTACGRSGAAGGRRLAPPPAVSFRGHPAHAPARGSPPPCPLTVQQRHPRLQAAGNCGPPSWQWFDLWRPATPHESTPALGEAQSRQLGSAPEPGQDAPSPGEADRSISRAHPTYCARTSRPAPILRAVLRGQHLAEAASAAPNANSTSAIAETPAELTTTAMCRLAVPVAGGAGRPAVDCKLVG